MKVADAIYWAEFILPQGGKMGFINLDPPPPQTEQKYFPIRTQAITVSVLFCSFLRSETNRKRRPILGRNWDKICKSFPPCYSQSPLTNFTPPPPCRNGLKPVCNVNIVYGNLKYENSQYDAPETSTKLYVHEFCFRRVGCFPFWYLNSKIKDGI